MSGWLKAGLIGAVIFVVFRALAGLMTALVPYLCCCTLPLEWVVYGLVGGCIGALAAHWMIPVRSLGPAAVQGALAAAIAAGIGGILGIGMSVVQAAVLGPMQIAEATRQLPPEWVEQMMGAGFDPTVLSGGVVETMVCGATCCSVSFLIAVAAGALGGLVYAGARTP
jgi:hypothetical protein